MTTTFDPHRNFVYSTVATAPTPASSGTTVTVQAGDGSLFPDPASVGAYNVVVCSAGTALAAEVCRVTAKTGDLLTWTRTQESSSARSVSVGDPVFMAITSKAFTDIQTATNTLETSVAAMSPITVYRKTTAKAVTNTVAETDLLNGEITVGAGVIGATGILRFSAWGDYVNNSGAPRIPQQFKLKLGGSTLIDTGVPVGTAEGAGATRFGWRVTVTIMNTATNVQVVYFDAVVTVQDNGAAAGVNSAFATGEGTVTNLQAASNTYAQVLYSGYNAGAVDTTAACALVLSVINPTATATYDTTLKSARVEVTA